MSRYGGYQRYQQFCSIRFVSPTQTQCKLCDSRVGKFKFHVEGIDERDAFLHFMRNHDTQKICLCCQTKITNNLSHYVNKHNDDGSTICISVIKIIVKSELKELLESNKMIR